MTAILKITDGTDEISLLRGEDGFALDNWTPAVAGYKAGGVFQESPLSDGRRLVSAVFNNVLETFSLKITADSMDEAITVTQNLRRLLQKAVQYWTTDWQNELVWIEAQATCESNLRYAIIQSYTAPQDDNPFAQPFLQSQKRAVMDEWTLVIERQHWQADQPGTATCVETSGTSDSFCYPHYLEFNGDTSEVDCGLGNGLDDLMDNAFTVEAWVRADSLGEADEGAIASKGSFLAEGWVFYMMGGVVPAAVTDAESFPLIGYLDILDGDWHHVAMTFDDAGDRRIDLFIDGVEVTYASHDAAVGAVVTDAAETFRIGNVDDGSRGFDGDIGWVRVSDSVRYTATFTPPLRCVIPGADANTLAIWIREGSGTAIDNAEGTASRDGTASNTSWNCDCDNLFGRAATCLNEVYIANKQNLAQLTHIFVDDGGVYGANLLGAALPYNLLPAVPAANDAIYFIIDSTAVDSGPFSSLVFDIGTAGAGYTGAWEYWDSAAWSALSTRDNTATTQAFDTAGVNSVHWIPPSDWATTTINGITGYIVRYRVVTVPGALTAPTQQNRHPYTIAWAYVDIDADQVTGDIHALTRILTSCQSFSAGAPTPTLPIDRIIAGLRSVSRGEDFTAYLNLSDEQNPSGITVNDTGASSFTNDVVAPSGRAIAYSPGGVRALTAEAAISFDSTVSTQFYGAYHAFLRVQQTAGSDGDIGAQLTVTPGTSASTTSDYYESAVAYTFDTSEYIILDMGKLTLFPGNIPAGAGLDNFTITINLSCSDAAATMTMYDLIIIPVDEWGLDTKAISNSGTLQAGQKTLDVDTFSYPKDATTALVLSDFTDNPVDLYSVASNANPFLQSNSGQRLWFTFEEDTAGILRSKFHVGASVQVEAVARYLSMRGPR